MPYEFEKYSAVALRVYSIMHDLTPHVMGVSVDEAYLDVTALVGDPRGGGPAGGDGSRETATSLYLHENEKQHRGTAREVAETLRARIFDETGCVASVGIGPNRLIARLATMRAKPDGVFQVTREDAEAYVASLPVRELPGVGRGALEKLSAELRLPNEKDVPAVACRDVLRVPSDRLQRALGRKSALSLRDACRGIDRRDWVSRPPRKSVGAQVTWGVRFDEAREVVAFAAKLAGEVAARARKLKVKGRCLTVKVLRAVANVPDGMMKGSVGHGVRPPDALGDAVRVLRRRQRAGARGERDSRRAGGAGGGDPRDGPAALETGFGPERVWLKGRGSGAEPEGRCTPSPRADGRSGRSGARRSSGGTPDGSTAKALRDERNGVVLRVLAGTLNATTRSLRDALRETPRRARPSDRVRAGRRPRTRRRWARGDAETRGLVARRLARGSNPKRAAETASDAKEDALPSRRARRVARVVRVVRVVRRRRRRRRASPLPAPRARRGVARARVRRPRRGEARRAGPKRRGAETETETSRALMKARAASTLRECESFALERAARAFEKSGPDEAARVVSAARRLARAQWTTPPVAFALCGSGSVEAGARAEAQQRAFADAWIEACDRAEEEVVRVALTQ